MKKENEQITSLTENDKNLIKALAETPREKQILIQGFMLGLGLNLAERKGA